jgi:hypothetical protein
MECNPRPPISQAYAFELTGLLAGGLLLTLISDSPVAWVYRPQQGCRENVRSENS